MIDQPFAPQGSTGRTDRKDFGMRSGVVEFTGPVACTSDDRAAGIDDHRADGHFATNGGGAGLGQGGLHVAAK